MQIYMYIPYQNHLTLNIMAGLAIILTAVYLDVEIDRDEILYK